MRVCLYLRLAFQRVKGNEIGSWAAGHCRRCIARTSPSTKLGCLGLA
jgi:hypothetical protein